MSVEVKEEAWDMDINLGSISIQVAFNAMEINIIT